MVLQIKRDAEIVIKYLSWIISNVPKIKPIFFGGAYSGVNLIHAEIKI